MFIFGAGALLLFPGAQPQGDPLTHRIKRKTGGGGGSFSLLLLLLGGGPEPLQRRQTPVKKKKGSTGEDDLSDLFILPPSAPGASMLSSLFSPRCAVGNCDV